MSKRSRDRARPARARTQGGGSPEGEVGPRQPCPCGSGKRYKACHGSATTAPYVARPFEGMPSEPDVVALREFVPAATAPLALRDSDRVVLLGTLLPGAAPAMVRAGGEIWLGLQVRHQFGDPARDLGAVLEKALGAASGETVGLTSDPGPGPRIQDLVEPGELDVTVHEGFGFWAADLEERGPEVEAALEQANGVVQPTARLASVSAAYWTDVTTKEHLRWVRPEPEDALLDALARLHVTGGDVLVEGARLVGHFRAHGLVVPVWDLPVGTGAEAVEDPAAQFGAALDAVLADPRPLTAQERSARSGITGRQVTIR